jgi:hypothetical protein
VGSRGGLFIYIGDRKEREEYMDDLERQMDDQREQIQRTLDRMEGSGRRGGALERLRGSLPRFPGRASARDAGETREMAPQSSDSPGPTHTRTPPRADEGLQSGSGERSWWRRLFGA